MKIRTRMSMSADGYVTTPTSWPGRYRALWEQRLDALHTEIAQGKREQRSTG